MTLTAAEILSIKSPRRLFGATGDIAYRAMAKVWHPDVGGDTTVFAHISDLWEKYKTPNKFEIVTNDGKILRRAYYSGFAHPVGQTYIGDVAVTHVFQPACLDLMAHTVDVIKGLPHSPTKVADEMARALPQIDTVIPERAMVLKKSPEFLSLADVKKHLGVMYPRHIAWIISRLMGIANYLSFAKISHNDIALENLFISPIGHSVALLGGWWYATPFGEKIKALPERTIKLAPSTLLRRRIGLPETDLELIRAVGRELAGDIHKLPQEFKNWLILPTTGNAFQDYQLWEKARDDSFGPQKFIKMDLGADDLY